LLLLQQAGLTDDLMIDLIQTDGSVFHLTAADIVDLHHKGLSDRVIRAMLGTTRKADGTPDVTPPVVTEPIPCAPPDERAQAVASSDAPSLLPPAPQSSEMAAPATSVDVVSQPTVAPPSPIAPAPVIQQVFVPVPVVVEHHRPTPPPPPPAPVYWGYGGQKKPGSWDEPGQSTPTPPAKPTTPNSGRGGI